MTLYELSLEYDRSSALLRERIVQLERVQRQEQDEQRRLQLAGRIRPLRAMYRETRAVYKHLEGYCRKLPSIPLNISWRAGETHDEKEGGYNR